MGANNPQKKAQTTTAKPTAAQLEKAVRSFYRKATHTTKEALAPHMALLDHPKVTDTMRRQVAGIALSVKSDDDDGFRIEPFASATIAKRATGKPGMKCAEWAAKNGAAPAVESDQPAAPVATSPSYPDPHPQPAIPAVPDTNDPLAAMRQASAAALAPLAAQAATLIQQAAAMGAIDAGSAYNVARQAEAQVAALKTALRNLKAL